MLRSTAVFLGRPEMLDVTMAHGELAAADRPGGAALADAGLREEKLSLPHSTMLIVLGSAGGWFLLAMAVRWLMS